MKSTFVLKNGSSNDLSTSRTKYVSMKMAAIMAILLFGLGIGAGYLIRSSVRNSSNESSVGKSADKNQVSYDECSLSAFIESVSLASESKNLGTLNATDVRNHLDFFLGTVGSSYASNIQTTFSCVDARADHPIFGTPGGDMGELAVGLEVYFKSVGIAPQLDIIRKYFQKFLKREIDGNRPFYFHTDDTRLRMVFKNVSTNFGRNVTVLPHVTPNDEEKEVWLRELTESYAQGCGHIRLMIETPSTYGLVDNFVIKSLIRVFYEEWWSRSQEEKQIFDFAVKLGPLLGGAIAIVENAGPGCNGLSPQVSPNIGGSTLFVYHANAVAEFREKVLTPFFIWASEGKLDNGTSFLSNFTALFTTQLTATLTNLKPANAVDLFSVRVKTK